MKYTSTPPLSRRQYLQCVLAGGGAFGAAAASRVWAQTAAPSATTWAATEAQAQGQKVYFNAWGGSDRVNAYLQWAAGELDRRYGIQLIHVKLTDTAEAVKRVKSEKAAGKLTGGSVDALWINGENFLTMKREGLLFGPFAESLPNFQYVDVQGKPSTRVDFSEPVQGYEAPWGMAQFTLFADERRVPTPPRSMAALADFARANPGRITYPRPPAFIGTTFLKQALVELTAGQGADRAPFDRAALDRAALYAPVTPEVFTRVTQPLWAYLAALHPALWRAGKQFPQTPAAIRQMMADGELLIALTFNPNEAANEIAAKRLPDTVYAWQMADGSLGNTHFLAIPFNTSAAAGAQVALNFLLSPQAQAHKADLTVWGDPSVLAADKLPPTERQRFTQGLYAGQVARPMRVIVEPHGSWVEPLEREWLRRYGQ